MADSLHARLPRLPRWGGRTDVQLVDLYTRGSLHLVYWFLLVMGTLATMGELTTTGQVAVAALAALLPGLSGAWLMHETVLRYPAGEAPPRQPVVLLVVLTFPVVAWVLSLPAEQAVGPALVVVGTLGFAFGGVRDRRVQAVVLLAGALVVAAAAGSAAMALYGVFLAGFFAFTVQSSLWLLGVVTELDRARRTQADLAVAEERLRFSRDVHDVMGRHLATIAVQAELAATLAERGDERAAPLVRQVRSTAHEAMREARELARGYRPLDLGQELQGAVSLLRSAGIEAHADLDGLPERWHAPVARLVREAVTNVLRHSEAGRVTITYTGGTVEVRNDGVDVSRATAGDGSGLRSLAADAAELGAGWEHGADGDEFVVRLRLAEVEAT
ncbi:sensor histidine kinase [Nocardioides campestrisoli]|uniref:sensor histidine kinase n=1 Tax=Nocardioides campestrisoli TaxID=2736757 RepID=UPI0015E76C49|nr:histidine kinase [Nocardioides campestrisoli]